MTDLFPFLDSSVNHAIPAICIEDRFISYPDFRARISAIARRIEELQIQNNSIGVYVSDHFDTYASIIAIWITGNTYVPIHPSYPPTRIGSIEEMANLRLVLALQENVPGISVQTPIVNTSHCVCDDATLKLEWVDREETQVAYILFTSGSTGTPKGVKITWRNLYSFIDHVDKMALDLPPRAGFLQMFEFTFDLSIVSILLPFRMEGTLYHVSSNRVKYLEIYRLLEEYAIHFAIIVPSVLAMLRPYFDSINLPDLRVVALSGEAVPLELTQSWQKCCTEAQFYNFYGPTECTIFCTTYTIPRTKIKSHNGIVCIGAPTNNTHSKVVGEQQEIIHQPGKKGELWIGGAQTSPGYLQNDELNQRLFRDYAGTRFYNTGDIVYFDQDGDYFYLGRKDHQVKLNGYRIELSEIEYLSGQYLQSKTAAIISTDTKGIQHLILFVQGVNTDTASIREQLKSALPAYMLPELVITMTSFPLNQNGKLDRNQLRAHYESEPS